MVLSLLISIREINIGILMNLEKAENEFDKYARKNDLTLDSIKRKYHHSYRVSEISKTLAEKQGFNKEEIELATLIGLIHDISRFEQWMRYGTYNDLKSIDHSDFAVGILQENNLLSNFVDDNKYNDIILKAIKNHNKFKIEDGLDEYVLKFCKLIKDADKIDIIYLCTVEYFKNENIRNEIEKSLISEECYNQIINNEQILRKYKKYPLDNVLNYISFIFDFNYEYSKKYIYYKNYINQIFELFDFSNNIEKEKIELIRKQANEFLKL